MKINVDPEKCSGCRLCETACTREHYNNYGSRTARVRVVKIESEGIDYPVLCQKCERPLCAEACPVEALTQDKSTGVIEVNEDICTSCGSCVKACPFGACNMHPQDMVPIMCDLCGGDPQCVVECPTDALTIDDSKPRVDFYELNNLAQQKRDKYARRMSRKMLEKWGDR